MTRRKRGDGVFLYREEQTGGPCEEPLDQPEGTLLIHSLGTFGHGRAFSTEGWVDPKNDLIRITLVQVADGTGDALGSVVMQIGEAAVE